MADIRTLTIPESQVGDRLDVALAALLPDLSRSRVKKLITDGQVSLRAPAPGEAPRTLTNPAERVKSGLRLRVAVPAATPAAPVAQAMPLAVAYEDADLIVVDKPAGLVVHPAPGNPDRTLVNALLAHCGDSLAGIGGVARPGIVHRLDKDTSGLMVAAKTDAAHAGLAEQFATRRIERAYRAVVWGVPRPARGRIEGNIGRSPTNRKKMAVVARAGKPAVTRYEIERRFGDAASLVTCRLETGRTHQIRVHLTDRGHPLVGDPVYGRRRRLPKQEERKEHIDIVENFPRQALHAGLLGFRHPLSGADLRFEAPLPQDMENLILALESL